MSANMREHKKKPVRQEIEESKTRLHPAKEEVTTASSSAGAGHSFANVPVKPAGQKQAGAEPQEETLYTVTINSRKFTDLTQTEAIMALKAVHRAIVIKTNGAEEAYKTMVKVHTDQWFTSAVSDLVGSIAHLKKVSLPPPDIWEDVHNNLNSALTAMNRGRIEEADDYLHKANEAYKKAYRIFYEYREETISGAEYTKAGLELTVETSKKILGTAAKLRFGEKGGKAIDVLYNVALDAATQGGELLAGTRKEFSVKQLGGKLLEEGMGILIGKLVDGVFSRYFMRHIGPYLSSSFSKQELEEMGKLVGLKGPLPRDYLFTKGQKYLAEFLKEVAASPFEKAVSAAVKRLTESEPKKAEEGTSPKPEKSMEEVITELSQEIIKELEKTSIKELFKEYVHHILEHHFGVGGAE